MWYFPQNGLGIESRAGELKNGCFAAVPSVEVEGNVAKIYLYSVDLGYGVYTLTCPEGTGVYDVEAETINAHKLLENGQVFIIKNGVIIAFFISNPLSQYYKTDRFSKILENISLNPNMFELKQNDSKLRIFSRNIETISKAYDVLKKL
mgnify:CR=1 FL=1